MRFDTWLRTLLDELPCAEPLLTEPWEVGGRAGDWVEAMASGLGAGWNRADGVAIHETATVEAGAVLKPPVVVGPGAFVAAHGYLRGGVYLGPEVTVGPGCELKACLVLARSAIAHLAFVGDAVVGADVNLEAGVVIANRRNETGRPVCVRMGNELIDTGVQSFGALVGDGARIGANAVLAPGTLIEPGRVVPRLGHVDQTNPQRGSEG